ncbi:MAG: protein kinase [Pirellulaceae bacterium]
MHSNRDATTEAECLGELETKISRLSRLQSTGSFVDEPECRASRQAILSIERPTIDTREIGPYIIEDLLGEGGMGTVYLARHKQLQQVVALKVLHRRQADFPMAASRFQTEIAAIGRLNHPNIVAARHAGDDANRLYLAMEYVDGTDLASLLIEHGPLSVPAVAEIGRQIASALHHAHEQNIIHRDVKPSNLILDDRGTVKLLDLGLARLLESPSNANGLTQSGQTLGTIDFMAPEQIEDSSMVDHRADIYALAATMYTLLTGLAPFDRHHFTSRTAQVSAILMGKPMALTVSRVCDDNRLDAIIERMLMRWPADRPQNLQEVIEQLTPIAAESRSLASAEAFVSTSNPSRSDLNRIEDPKKSERSSISWLRIPHALPRFTLAPILALILAGVIIKMNRPGKETHVIQLTNGDSFTIVATDGSRTVNDSIDVARWVIEAGGHFYREHNGKLVVVHAMGEIPDDGLSIRSINLSNCKAVTADQLKQLGQLPNLSGLVLDGTAVDDKIVKILRQFPRLQALYLRRTAVTDQSMTEIGRKQTLRGIALEATAITDGGLSLLANNQHLEKLLLNDTAVSDQGLRTIKDHFPLLSHLEIANTKLTESAVHTLESMKSLRYVDVRGNGFTSEAIDAWRQTCPNCKIVDR